MILTESELARELESLPEWEVEEGWLRRVYRTGGWPQTMMLVQAIGLLAEAAWHHPDLRVGYAQVVVLLQTHRVGGITAMDVALAREIEARVLWKPAPDSPLDGYPKPWIH